MAIPLSIFYYLYLFFILVFLAFSFFNVYTLLRFGFLTLSNLIIVVFYLAVSVLILTISWNYIGQIDWHQSVYFASTL
jgi:hypothetical protein